MKVERIDHIHIFVKDLEKSKGVFSRILGTKFCEPMVSEEWGLKSVLDPLGVELMASTSPEGFIAKTIERRGEGLAAISLKVPDIEEAIAELTAMGLRLVSRFEVGQLKEAHFHPKDAFGVMIELCEYREEHGAYRAIYGRSINETAGTARSGGS